MEKRIHVEKLIQTMQIKRKLQENRELDCRLFAKDSWVSTSVLKTERPRSVQEIKTTLQKFRNVSSESQFKSNLQSSLQNIFSYDKNASHKDLDLTESVYVKKRFKKKSQIKKKVVNYNQKVEERNKQKKLNLGSKEMKRKMSYKRLHQKKITHREKSFTVVIPKEKSLMKNKSQKTKKKSEKNKSSSVLKTHKNKSNQPSKKKSNKLYITNSKKLHNKLKETMELNKEISFKDDAEERFKKKYK
jgi:hypothetical protein